jgi:hypothetical protein
VGRSGIDCHPGLVITFKDHNPWVNFFSPEPPSRTTEAAGSREGTRRRPVLCYPSRTRRRLVRGGGKLPQLRPVEYVREEMAPDRERNERGEILKTGDRHWPLRSSTGRGQRAAKNTRNLNGHTSSPLVWDHQCGLFIFRTSLWRQSCIRTIAPWVKPCSNVSSRVSRAFPSAIVAQTR